MPHPTRRVEPSILHRVIWPRCACQFGVVAMCELFGLTFDPVEAIVVLLPEAYPQAAAAPAEARRYAKIAHTRTLFPYQGKVPIS